MSTHAGRVAVVTGASRGLGAGLADTFALNGMLLGLCARTRPDARDGETALSASVDVSDADAVDAFAREVVERFGRVDLWVNNAGVLAPIGRLADADPVVLRRHLDVNVLGVAHGTAAFVRHLRERPGEGVLVNISSGAATTPYEGWAAYCASKAAVDMITEVVAREERSTGLRAYALAPGVVDTDMQTLIRATTEEAFPAVRRFRRLHQEGAFNSADWVARFILERCLGKAGVARTGHEADIVRLRVPDQPGRPEN
ncbi:MAG TPA: SDR family NAD(P)-dependent oxidoreductase [Acidimicrobiales bacterium]|nr:SDR family NAD(P)-dependent oxidoreductase [Acidimicrobiales bacterium]